VWRSSGARVALLWCSCGAPLVLVWRSSGARVALLWCSCGAEFVKYMYSRIVCIHVLHLFTYCMYFAFV